MPGQEQRKGPRSTEAKPITPESGAVRQSSFGQEAEGAYRLHGSGTASHSGSTVLMSGSAPYELLAAKP
jgi:hypothetical protein